MRWHNGQIRRPQNPNSEEVFQDCVTKWEKSVAHSILARSLFTPPKAVYICADQPCPSFFRLQLGGGPYIPRTPFGANRATRPTGTVSDGASWLVSSRTRFTSARRSSSELTAATCSEAGWRLRCFDPREELRRMNVQVTDSLPLYRAGSQSMI